MKYRLIEARLRDQCKGLMDLNAEAKLRFLNHKDLRAQLLMINS